MPKQEQRAEINSFVKGLITEASELNFPPDAFSNVENFELNRNGTINRRLGMDYEENAIQRSTGLTDINVSTAKINTFRWLSVDGDTTQDFLVVQFGQKLFFYDLAINPLSSGYVGEIVLTAFPETTRFSFAALEGRLVVAAGVDTIAVISYPGFDIEYGRLLTRDVWGVEETDIPSYETDPSFRTSDFNQLHNYNLVNQSWGISRKNSTGFYVDPITQYKNDLGVYPSNSEQVWPGLQFQAVAPGQDPFERLYTNLFNEVIGAKVVTAKGYFIIDALRRGQSRIAAFNNNKAKYPVLDNSFTGPTDLTTGGCSCVADFAGRVFYGGFNGEVVGGDQRSPEYSNYLFFSQVVKSKSDFFKCYQEGDPTSRDNADLVDTDGGFIRISGAKDIIAVRNLETSLVIFCSNGIWSVTGGAVDSGFSATNYKATKISSFGCLSDSSIVVEGGRAYYWAEDGIYSVGRNELGDISVNNITLTTIQKFYEAIPNLSKLNVIGSYDIFTRKVRWIYKEGDVFTETSTTKELVFDSALGAFSPNRIVNLSTFSVEVFSLFRSSTFVIDTSGAEVFANTDQVLVGTEEVVISTSGLRSGLQSTKYLAITRAGINQYNFTFSEYNQNEWLDWKSFNGVGTDAFAFGYSGVQTAGDSSTKKQIPYLVFHMYRTETGSDSLGNPINPSGCRVRYQWGFSNDPVSKKFSTLFQVYRYVKTFIPAIGGGSFNNGMSILTTKNKVRGMGRAFQMYLQTEAGKDCRVVGWNLTLTGNQIT